MHHARIIAAAGIRQTNAVAMADGIAARADWAVRQVWLQFLKLLRKPQPYFQTRTAVAALLHHLPRHTAEVLAYRFDRLARWGWKTATENVVKHVPQRMLAAAVVLRQKSAYSLENISQVNGHRSPDHVKRPLLEADPSVDWIDVLFPFRDKKKRIEESDWHSLLFPPMDQETVDDVVYSSGWYERFLAGSRLANPEDQANIVATGLMTGKSHQEIARDLLPLFNGNRVSARRVARTEGLRVASAIQMKCHDQLGDLVTGYQIHATLDSHTRSWHAHRSGTIYWKNPGGNQKGLYQMPNPPDEADDPAERPPGTPKTAFC
jgi:hypothetical protein